jgi:hypothetical protein
MQTMILTCGVGLGYGLRHALESDHVAAVTTLVVDGKGAGQAASLGACWGAGHGLAVLGAGSLLLALDVTVPANVALGLELGVVAMLLGLGVRSLVRRTPHEHEHAPPSRGTRTPLQATAVGLVHGAAGTAALVVLMAGLAPTRLYGALFLGTFAVGATLSMTLLSALLAAPLGRLALRMPAIVPRLRVGAGALSLVAAGMLFFELLHRALAAIVDRRVRRAFPGRRCCYPRQSGRLSTLAEAPCGTAARRVVHGSARRLGAASLACARVSWAARSRSRRSPPSSSSRRRLPRARGSAPRPPRSSS